MKRLLIVTDHRFYAYDGELYDNYVFDYNFFLDYLTVFDKVTVMARVKNLNCLPTKYKKTSGANLNFLPISDFHGLKWFLGFPKIPNELINEQKFDAICYRIPSMLSYRIWRIFQKKSFDVPHMFEFLGDPKDALINKNDLLIKQCVFHAIGDLMNLRMRKIVNSATCGSYVSFNHLQQKFPVNSMAVTSTISSIRLDSKYIKVSLEKINLNEINIVHVGSFVPVKNHDLLIQFIKKLKGYGINANLTFLGNGPLIDSIKQKSIDLNVDDRISFEGHITGFENIVKKLDAHNVFILPSFSEGMPRSLIEAMSRGLLCFGSDRGGSKELLEQEFTFDPTDLNDLFSKFNYILNNPFILEKNRKLNLEKVKVFEQKTLSSKRIELLNHLISN
jgi:glycosyltransferase involved in cell wall biosynthesis